MVAHKIPVAVVSGIRGNLRHNRIQCIGAPGHSGAIPRWLRRDAMFAVADLLLLNKADMLTHLKFDVGKCLAAALKVNPHLQTLVVSAETGEGMAAFYAWIEARAAMARATAAAEG